jgi:opacity protein-like surface antigen
MSRILAGALLAALAVSPALAADTPRNDARAAGQSRAIGGAVAPYARVALMYDYQYGVIRSKGVTSVRRVGVGHYCIRPSSMTTTDVQAAVPTATPDYSGSSGVILFAYVRTASPSCYTYEFGVQTARGANGAFGVSNVVGFTFIVN